MIGCYHRPQNKYQFRNVLNFKCAPPRRKKSLAGLDSTQTEGVNAVAYLEAITDFLRKNDENDDDVSISVAC